MSNPPPRNTCNCPRIDGYRIQRLSCPIHPSDPWAAVGFKPEDCRCVKTRPPKGSDPQPVAWETADDCPLHSLHPAPGSAQEPADPPLDLEALAAKWLEPCGYCDGGLPMSCTHPTDDYRVPMLALVLEVERLRGQS